MKLDKTFPTWKRVVAKDYTLFLSSSLRAEAQRSYPFGDLRLKTFLTYLGS